MIRGFISIGKVLPGEREGTINPEDYGIQVIKEEEPVGPEIAEDLRKSYEDAKERSGVADPKLEQYIGELAAGRVVSKSEATPRRRGFKLRLREASPSD